MQKIQKTLLAEAQEYAKRVVASLNESCTHFHAVNYLKNRLRENGFNEIREIDAWKLEAGKSYFFTRNNSTIVAFQLGSKVNEKGVSAFKIIGCHTDSPVLKLAPFAKLDQRMGFQQMNVQTYGGGLWHTWFDRDLCVGGRIIVNENGKFVSKYWRSKDALVKVPNLAIHLTDRSDKFEPSKEAHTKPILATSIIDQLFGSDVQPLDEDKYQIEQKHFTTLLQLISSNLGIDRAQIIDFELSLFDSTPSQIIGLHKEFVSSARLDNLGSSIIAVDSIIDSHKAGPPSNADCNMILLFDHEEIGSQSAQGADSNLVVETTQRVFEGCFENGKQSEYYRAIRQSFLLSCDMAHGLHPNYSDKNHPQHAPKLHHGMAVKINANQRYATHSVSSSILRAIAEKIGAPLQEFIVKNDSPCGSTIGPILASKAGIKTLDMGAPMLGMHSIRETCGVVDLLHNKNLFDAYFKYYSEISHDLLGE